MAVRKVPFYSNTKDDMHCVQASLRSILKFFLPGREFTFEELDELTSHAKGKGTWFFSIYPFLKELGFEVKEIGKFDLRRFYKEGKTYLYETLPEHQADWYMSKSNLMAVKDSIPEAVEGMEQEVRSARIKDFEELIANGYLIITDVNGYVLVGKEGYTSHAVVVFGFDGKDFHLHDPGLPARESVKVSRKLLEKAGADNIAAFKLSLYEGK